MSDCVAINPDGTRETPQDTINRLVKNRNEIVQHLEKQKAIAELAVKALEWYADADNYTRLYETDEDEPELLEEPIMTDDGEQARLVLEEIKRISTEGRTEHE